MDLLEWARRWPERSWAIEGAAGRGHLLGQQLLAAGERVLDVQPKLAARVLLLNTGRVNKNDPNDARSVAIAALRSPDVRAVADDQAVVITIWPRRHRDLSRALADITPLGATGTARLELAYDATERLERRHLPVPGRHSGSARTCVVGEARANAGRDMIALS